MRRQRPALPVIHFLMTHPWPVALTFGLQMATIDIPGSWTTSIGQRYGAVGGYYHGVVGVHRSRR